MLPAFRGLRRLVLQLTSHDLVMPTDDFDGRRVQWRQLTEAEMKGPDSLGDALETSAKEVLLICKLRVHRFVNLSNVEAIGTAISLRSLVSEEFKKRGRNVDVRLEWRWVMSRF
jgi:hypothetical protein